jgi:hypothetical protein
VALCALPAADFLSLRSIAALEAERLLAEEEELAGSH